MSPIQCPCPDGHPCVPRALPVPPEPSLCPQGHPHVPKVISTSPELCPCPQAPSSVPKAIPMLLAVSPGPGSVPRAPAVSPHLQGVDAGADVAVGFLAERQQRSRVRPHSLLESNLPEQDRAQGQPGDTARGQGGPGCPHTSLSRWASREGAVRGKLSRKDCCRSGRSAGTNLGREQG